MYTPDIIYEDADILVCRKPAGLAVQTKRLGQQDMETGLKNYLVRKKEKPYIGVIHRLDQPVEGIMVFAKNPKAAAELSRQVQGREIGKYYYAIGCKSASSESKTTESKAAESRPLPSSGTLTDYLGFDPKKNLGYITTAADAAKDKTIKRAVLDYKVIDSFISDSFISDSFISDSLVSDSTASTANCKEGENVCFDITLHTGRHHQIRLQLAHLGYPLLGDAKYGGPAAEQIALCSYRLQFRHPVNGKNMDFAIFPENPAFEKYRKNDGHLL